MTTRPRYPCRFLVLIVLVCNLGFVNIVLSRFQQRLCCQEESDPVDGSQWLEAKVQRIDQRLTWIELWMRKTAALEVTQDEQKRLRQTVGKTEGGESSAADEVKKGANESGQIELQDSSNGRCCHHPSIKGERMDSCMETCFTERACVDEAYPFRSAEEKAAYARWEPKEHEKAQLRRVCNTAMNRGAPPSRWCQKSDDINLTHIPTGCSRFSAGPRSGPFQSMYLFPEGKLALCMIPKVGLSQWQHFLRYTILAWSIIFHFSMLENNLVVSI